MQVKRLTLGQRIAQSSRQAAETANVWDTSSGRQRLQGMIQTDPGDTTFAARLAQINRTYPRIDLRPTRFASYMKEKFPAISWEPNLDVCLDFFLRFHKLINENPDEASSVLLTFIRDHQIECDWSGWVIFAAGWICLGFSEVFRPDGKPRAAKFFKSYNGYQHRDEQAAGCECFYHLTSSPALSLGRAQRAPTKL